MDKRSAVNHIPSSLRFTMMPGLGSIIVVGWLICKLLDGWITAFDNQKALHVRRSQQATSSYIKLHQATSSYIKLHQATSSYIKLHQRLPAPCCWLCRLHHVDTITRGCPIMKTKTPSSRRTSIAFAKQLASLPGRRADLMDPEDGQKLIASG